MSGTDGRMDRPKPICPLNFSEVGSIKIDKNENSRVDSFEMVPYFLGYKTDFFSFQNNPKDLDPSYKTDLDL